MPKLIQNRPPEGPKSTPGGSKIDPRGLPEGKSHTEFLLGSFFAPPGAHLGSPGALLGLSWGSRSAPGNLWGRPGRLQHGSPEASRTGAGTGTPYFRKNELAPRREHDFRGSRGLQNGSKIDPKWLQNRSREASGSPTGPGAQLGDLIFAKKRPRSKHSSFLAPKINLAIMEREARETRERASNASKARAERAARTARAEATRQRRAARRE